MGKQQVHHSRPPQTAANISARSAKDRYLQLATELAERRVTGRPAFPFVVSHITIEQTAAEMGVSRTRLYKLWPSKADFWSDLVRYVGLRDLSPESVSAEFFTGTAVDLAGADEPIRVAMNQVQQWTRRDEWLALRTALAGYADNDRVAAMVATTQQESISARTAFGVKIFEQLRIRPVAPLQIRDIAVAFDCLIDGLASGARLVPTLDAPDIFLDEPGDRPWGLLAYGFRCLLHVHTTPTTTPSSHPGPRTTEVASHPSDWTGTHRAALATAAGLLHRDLVANPPSAATRGVPAPLGHITIDVLARSAGVSRQAVQRVWPSQQHLRDDMMRYLYERERRRTGAALGRAIRAGLRAERDACLVLAERLLDRWLPASEPLPLTHLVYAAHYHEPAIRAIGSAALDRIIQQVATDLRRALDAVGYRLRSGVTARHVAALLLLTGEAAACMRQTNPGEFRPAVPFRGGRRTPMAIMLAAFLEHSLER